MSFQSSRTGETIQEKEEEVMYDESLKIPKRSKFGDWLCTWAGDWCALFDVLVGVLTLTFYYPDTQGWFYSRIFYGRANRK